MMFRGSSTLQQLLKAAKDFVTKHTHDIKWPREMKSYEPPLMLRYKDAITVYKSDRTLVALEYRTMIVQVALCILLM